MTISHHIKLPLVLVTAALAAGILFLDYVTELGVAGGVPYVALVMMGLFYKSPRVTLYLGISGVVLTIVGYFLSPQGGEHWKVMLNRLYAVLVICIATYFVMRQIKVQILLADHNKNLERVVAQRTKEIKRKSEELEEFAYIASHDLKAPVSNLESLVGMIDYPDLANQSKHVILEKLKESIVRFKFTISGLNRVLELEQSLNQQKERLRFDDLAAEIEQSVAQLLDANDGRIIHDFSKCPSAQYPYIQLKSILLNLVSNAIKYRNPNRPLEILVSTSEEEGVPVLVVKDNGLGFDVEKYGQKVIGLFKRLHPNVEGQGVGLYIINKIVTSHGGELSMHSVPGDGATFRIKLYAHDEQDLNH